MKEKDYIEEIILKNIEELNDNEPMEGHFARFEAKLNAQATKKKRLSLMFVLKVAAVIVFAFLATNQAFIYFSPSGQGLIPGKSNQAITLASISPEYQEVEFYYTSAINSGLEQWNRMNAEGLISDEEQGIMDEELKEFEDLYTNLQKDLQLNPNDERVINAMLEYYQAKLSIINIIIDKLEEVQLRKNMNYEPASTVM